MCMQAERRYIPLIKCKSENPMYKNISILKGGHSDCDGLGFGVRDGNADFFDTGFLCCICSITVELLDVSNWNSKDLEIDLQLLSVHPSRCL